METVNQINGSNGAMPSKQVLESVEKNGASSSIFTSAPKVPKITPADIKAKSKLFSENVNALADSIDSTTNSVTNAAAKTTGACALIGGAFSKLIPTCIKDFFATPQYVMKDGKAVLNEAGQKIFLMKKGSDGIEKVVRKFNGKNTLIALGVIAGATGLYALYRYIKNKKANSAPVQQPPPAAK